MGKTQYVIVRSPGHWIHVGLVDFMDAAEIRLTNAFNIRRWQGCGLEGLRTGPKKDTVFGAVGTIRLTNGPGVFVYEDVTGWEDPKP